MGSDDKPSPLTPETTSYAESSSSVSRVVHAVVIGLLIAGGIAYWLWKPASLNPMADARAADAMALVQTHRALQAPTLLQAVSGRVRAMAVQGQGVRLGEWRVERQAEDIYLVRVIIREQGTKQWFEREYVWRADLAKRSVQAISLPAMDLMPPEPGEVPRPAL